MGRGAFFQPGGIVSYRENYIKGDSDQIYPWLDGAYTYDMDGKLLIISFVDIHVVKLTAYDGGNSFVLLQERTIINNVLQDAIEVIFTKQDTLPDWAEEAE